MQGGRAACGLSVRKYVEKALDVRREGDWARQWMLGGYRARARKGVARAWQDGERGKRAAGARHARHARVASRFDVLTSVLLRVDRVEVFPTHCARDVCQNA